MDLSFIVNDDGSAPPRRPSQASPPAPSPASIPAPAPSPIKAPPPPIPVSAPPPITPPAPKRRKIRDKPLWAQKWSSDWRSKPWAAGAPPAAAAPPPQRHSPMEQRPVSAQKSNGLIQNTQSPVNIPGSAPPRRWEANIVDRVPLDQMSRLIADFLFTHIVNASELGPDATFEVEAKLGHLINQNTNERLRIPVLTDVIIDKNDPAMRTAFKSSMTELQHRAFNEFLNEALMKSLPPKGPAAPVSPPRIPLSYKHTRQTDTFYEMTQEASSRLPPSILGMFNQRVNKARIRVTTDQKTQQETAKIIKIRVADLDIHSPTTLFDYRISINIEVDYKGPTKELVRVLERGQPTAPRSKDRMTYNHLVYQIDLTQVTSPGPDQSKEHELEVEICNMAELRKQGLALSSGQENNYEQIVRGFVDNVRLLQRQLRPDHG